MFYLEQGGGSAHEKGGFKRAGLRSSTPAFLRGHCTPPERAQELHQHVICSLLPTKPFSIFPSLCKCFSPYVTYYMTFQSSTYNTVVVIHLYTCLSCWTVNSFQIPGIKFSTWHIIDSQEYLLREWVMTLLTDNRALLPLYVLITSKVFCLQ